MDRLRMRTTLLIPLLVLSFGCTVLSLLVIRTIVEQQTQSNLASDLQHSVKTYRNFQHQQRELLARESALLADLPSLKSLMTTYDAANDRRRRSRVLAGERMRFLRSARSERKTDRCLQSRSCARSNRGSPGLEVGSTQVRSRFLLALDDRIYEISTQPLYFGPKEHGTLLGFVAVVTPSMNMSHGQSAKLPRRR